MFGLYKYENGLQFTGKIARTEEEAKSYIAQICGRIQPVFTGRREEDGTPIYEDKLVPNYNVETFTIQPLDLI